VRGDFEDHCWKDIVSAETLEIYSRYQRDVHIERKAAIVVIDLFNKVFDGGNRPVVEVDKEHPGACGEHAWRAIEPTMRLLEAGRTAGLPIIYSTCAPDQSGKLRATNRPLSSMKSLLDPWGIKEEFKPHQGDLIIYKERASVFFGTPLQAYLQRMDINCLIVCGESTSGCVRASIVDGYSHGFHVAVAEECTFDRSLLSHKVNLFDIHHKYADVMHVDYLIEEINALV